MIILQSSDGKAKRYSIQRKIFSQYKTPTWVAAIRNVFSGAQFYLSAIQFTMIASLAYEGGVGQQLKIWFPWITFVLYLGTLAIGYLFLMLFEWKVVYPSLYRLTNEQGWKHDSPVREEIKSVKDQLNELRKQVDYLVSEKKKRGG